MAAAQIADALTQHDKVRRSTDIPLFYGRKEKDTISPHQLLERINRAKRVARWADDERVCDEFYLCLRDRAISWSNTLDNIPNFDKNNWAAVQREFLAAYAPKFTARTLCTSFHDLKQKNDENVQDFYNRVSEVFRDAFMIKPAHVTQHGGTAAERFDLTEANAQTIMLRGINNMQLLVMNTMFIGGLKDEIRSKVLETGPTLIQDSVKLAREFEIITREKKERNEKGVYVHTIAASDAADVNDDPDILDVDVNDIEHILAINVIRKKANQPPLRYKVKSGSSNAKPWTNRSSVNIPQCRFCKLKNHMQRECRKRIAAGAPMVDAAGRPFPASMNQNPITSSSWSPQINSVSSPYYGLMPHHLN